MRGKRVITKYLGPDQSALMLTLGIFKVSRMDDEMSIHPYPFTQEYDNLDPWATWDEVEAASGFVPILTEARLEKYNLNDDDRRAVERLNEFIEYDCMYNKNNIIFDTFLRWLYDITYGIIPPRVYSDHHITSKDPGYKYENRRDPVNRGQFALMGAIEFIEKYKRYFDDNMITMAHLPFDISPKVLETLIKAFVNKDTIDYNNKDEVEINLYMLDVFTDLAINAINRKWGYTLFDLLYEAFKEAYDYYYFGEELTN